MLGYVVLTTINKIYRRIDDRKMIARQIDRQTEFCSYRTVSFPTGREPKMVSPLPSLKFNKTANHSLLVGLFLLQSVKTQ